MSVHPEQEWIWGVQTGKSSEDNLYYCKCGWGGRTTMDPIISHFNSDKCKQKMIKNNEYWQAKRDVAAGDAATGGLAAPKTPPGIPLFHAVRDQGPPASSSGSWAAAASPPLMTPPPGIPPRPDFPNQALTTCIDNLTLAINGFAKEVKQLSVNMHQHNSLLWQWSQQTAGVPSGGQSDGAQSQEQDPDRVDAPVLHELMDTTSPTGAPIAPQNGDSQSNASERSWHHAAFSG